MTWIEKRKEGVVLKIYVQPGASKSEVVGPHGDRLKVRVKAAPENGKANKELIRFLSKLLKIPKASMELIRGHASRQKDVLCAELEPDTISECFE